MHRDKAIITQGVLGRRQCVARRVFMTTIPCRVAASLSILSVPTPARTIARSRLLPSSDAAVIFTPSE